MLQTAAKMKSVSPKHLIDLKTQAGIQVIIDGQPQTLSDLLLLSGSLYTVIDVTDDSIIVKTENESEAI